MVGGEHEPAVTCLGCGHGDPLVHRKAMGAGELLEESDQLGRSGKALGVSRDAITRHPVEVVRRVHLERAPPLGTPGLGDPSAVEDDMLDFGVLQMPAHCQPGGSRPHHHGLERRHCGAGYRLRFAALTVVEDAGGTHTPAQHLGGVRRRLGEWPHQVPESIIEGSEIPPSVAVVVHRTQRLEVSPGRRG